MSDIIDHANDQAQEELERNLAKAQRFDQPSLEECMDCGEDIPYQRQQIGGVKRCIECQACMERRR